MLPPSWEIFQAQLEKALRKSGLDWRCSEAPSILNYTMILTLCKSKLPSRGAYTAMERALFRLRCLVFHVPLLNRNVIRLGNVNTANELSDNINHRKGALNDKPCF